MEYVMCKGGIWTSVSPGTNFSLSNISVHHYFTPIYLSPEASTSPEVATLPRNSALPQLKGWGGGNKTETKIS